MKNRKYSHHVPFLAVKIFRLGQHPLSKTLIDFLKRSVFEEQKLLVNSHQIPWLWWAQHFNFLCFYPIGSWSKIMVAGRGAQFLKENLLAWAGVASISTPHMQGGKNSWCKDFSEMHHINFFSMRRMNYECKKCWQKFILRKLHYKVFNLIYQRSFPAPTVDVSGWLKTTK